MARSAVVAKELGMATEASGRRDFLKRMTALGAASLPLSAALRPQPVRAAASGARTIAKAAYDPAAKFGITVSEIGRAHV